MELPCCTKLALSGFPVIWDFDSLLDLEAVGVMEGGLDGFDSDIDDDLFRCLPLDFPEEKNEQVHIKAEPESPDKFFLRTHPDDVAVPEDFPFPFKPYDIQEGFMRQLYRTIECGRIGIFESPTGTGKSLSLICGSLMWLREHEQQELKDLEDLLNVGINIKDIKTEDKTDNSEVDWVSAFAKKQELDEKAKKLQEEKEQRLKREERLKALRNNLRPNGKRKRHTLEQQFTELFKDAPKDLQEQLNADLENIENQSVRESHEDEMIVVDEYHSDDELHEKDSSDEEDDVTGDNVTKIYYCSRTHSQLAQFVREVQKSPFGEETRVVTLGSRQNLCINDAVRRLKSISLINDRCLELQKNKTSTKKKPGESATKRKKLSGGCPFYKADAIKDFTDRVLVEVKDIEQLVADGRQAKACPYYGTRHSVPAAQLVAMPYNLLLHQATRQSCGLQLRGNVVIIDEAHNLAETISSIHSVTVTGSQLLCAFSQLTQYMERYQTRLKAKNLMYIKQILFILSSLIKYMGGKTNVPADQQKLPKTESKLQTINDFLFDTRLDNLNLFKIMRYCERSYISKKLHGFVEKYQPAMVLAEENEKKETVPMWALSKFLKEISQAHDKSPNKEVDKTAALASAGEPGAVFSSPLMHIESFLQALTNSNKDGRIVINKQELLSDSTIKFLLLNPAVHFADVLQEARAVIVAGGTMQPISEFQEQLFLSAGIRSDQILEFSCGHVIPEENLLPIALARGSSGQEFDFTYQNRMLPEMMDELGRVIYNLCHVVPGGIVVFFPSYEYEKVVYTHWQKSGYLQKMASKKKVLREPRKASQVDVVLTEYSICITRSQRDPDCALTGAMLLCVVGGKMSEGINFSDDMGRCVVMVGLPYPNMHSPELKEKMSYLNAHMSKDPSGKLPGQIHYENLCFKAVNQSIGRAIRHKGDYSTIVLCDHRYLRPSTRSKLPGWIAERLQAMDRFGPAFAAIRKNSAALTFCTRLLRLILPLAHDILPRQEGTESEDFLTTDLTACGQPK